MKESSHEPWWTSGYGADDQLGSLNEITPEKIVDAARLVQSGKVYDLGRVLHANVPRFWGRYWQQTLVSSSYIINQRRPDGVSDGKEQNRINWITELVTGTMQMGMHLDGLNHLQVGDCFSNGFQTREIIEEWGTSKLGIESVPHVITHGALVDIALSRGVTQMKEGEVITPEDVEGVLKRQGVVSQRLNLKHGLFIMENLDTSFLAAENVYEFMFVLTHYKTRGPTAAWVSPIAVV